MKLAAGIATAVITAFLMFGILTALDPARQWVARAAELEVELARVEFDLNDAENKLTLGSYILEMAEEGPVSGNAGMISFLDGILIPEGCWRKLVHDHIAPLRDSVSSAQAKAMRKALFRCMRKK